MTHAALYEDSQQFRRDGFIRRYYKADYIALNRFITKVWMTLFYAAGLVAYIFQLVYVESVDLLHVDYQGFVINAAASSLLISGLVCTEFGGLWHSVCQGRKKDEDLFWTSRSD